MCKYGRFRAKQRKREEKRMRKQQAKKLYTSSRTNEPCVSEVVSCRPCLPLYSEREKFDANGRVGAKKKVNAKKLWWQISSLDGDK